MKRWVPLAALALALSPLAVVHPVRVQGRSMEPALRNGDVRWVVRAWAVQAPRRGEIWLVEGPEGAVVKRVLGLPGERLEWREGLVVLGGTLLEEPYVRRLDLASSGAWEARDGYLVLGDNRPESRDSRTWGPLPRQAFRGRVLD